MKKSKKEFDVWIYWILFILGIGYLIYIRQTCEEIGCLAIALPIIWIFIISGIELIVSIVIATKNKGKLSLSRIVTITISGIISILALITIIFSNLN